MMNLCTETITVFNRALTDNGDYKYFPTVITGVSIFGRVETTITDDGLKAADTVTIRIPTDADFSGKSYVRPHEFRESQTGFWTLDNGDLIVEGSESSSLSPKQLEEKYGRVYVILGVTDNRRAYAKHWKVTTK